MKNIKSIITISCLIIISLTTSCEDSCKGHENFIKNSFESRAQNNPIMKAKIESLSVEYVGDCKYRVKESYWFSNGQYQTLDHIYTWENGHYVY